MRRVTMPAAAAIATLGLAACSAPPPTSGANQEAAAKPDPGCEVHSHSGRFRPGDNLPVNMRVQNTGHWCFYGMTFSGSNIGGSRVIDAASHGDVRLLVRGASVIFGYRPKPAYVGGDSFIISVPGGDGYDSNLAVNVTVPP